jgi:hypothetical protein
MMMQELRAIQQVLDVCSACHLTPQVHATIPVALVIQCSIKHDMYNQSMMEHDKDCLVLLLKADRHTTSSACNHPLSAAHT